MRQQLPPYITGIISDYPHYCVIYLANTRVSENISETLTKQFIDVTKNSVCVVDECSGKCPLI